MEEVVYSEVCGFGSGEVLAVEPAEVAAMVPVAVAATAVVVPLAIAVQCSSFHPSPELIAAAASLQELCQGHLAVEEPAS